MAPGLLSATPDAPHTLADKRDNNNAPKHIFPDGIRTSGQLAPIYELLRPFSQFPKEITGPTVWKKEDYEDHPEKWVHNLTPEEQAELGKAADDFIASNIPLTGISEVYINRQESAVHTDEVCSQTSLCPISQSCCARSETTLLTARVLFS